jgi:hypothetical protein
MASSVETIKSFLVSLGWKVDTAGMRRFASSIAVQSEAVRELGEAIKGVASRVIDFVRDIGEGMDKLYFASQRTKSSANNLTSLSYAMEQMGLSGEAATKAVENLREFLFKNPGGESIIQSLGIQTRDARGNLRDLSDVWRELMKKLATEPPGLAATYSSMFGTDFQTMIAAGQGKFEEYFEQHQQMLKAMGLSEDQAAEISNQFMSRLRQLAAEVTILAQKVGSEILAKAMPSFQKFVTYVVAHMPEIEVAIENFITECGPVATTVVEMAKKAIAAIESLISWWNSLGETGQTVVKWIIAITAVVAALVAGLTVLGTIVAAVTTALELIGAVIGALASPVTLVIAGIAALAVGVYELWKHFDLVKAEVKVLADVFMKTLKPVLSDVGDLLKDIFTGHWGDAKKKAADIANLTKKGVQEAGAAMRQTYAEVEGKKAQDQKKAQPAATQDQKTPAQAGVAAAPVDKSQPRGIRNNNPGNINYGEFAREHGSTGVESAGRFATFATAQDGLDADAALLRSYAKRGIDSVRAIISKYAPAGENNTENYISTVAKRLGVGSDAHLNLSDPRMLAGIEQAIVQMENGKNPYSADMYALAANRAIGGGAATNGVQIAQTNTITVTGSGNPQDTAQAIGNAMRTSNDQLVRNVQGRIS